MFCAVVFFCIPKPFTNTFTIVYFSSFSHMSGQAFENVTNVSDLGWEESRFNAGDKIGTHSPHRQKTFDLQTTFSIEKVFVKVTANSKWPIYIIYNKVESEMPVVWNDSLPITRIISLCCCWCCCVRELFFVLYLKNVEQ